MSLVILKAFLSLLLNGHVMNISRFLTILSFILWVNWVPNVLIQWSSLLSYYNGAHCCKLMMEYGKHYDYPCPSAANLRDGVQFNAWIYKKTDATFTTNWTSTKANAYLMAHTLSITQILPLNTHWTRSLQRCRKQMVCVSMFKSIIPIIFY